jgi:hypothetical protein
MIAERFNLQARKLVIDRLDFLQAGNIGRGLLQPVLEVLDTGFDAVDVPGRDFHIAMIMRLGR